MLPFALVIALGACGDDSTPTRDAGTDVFVPMDTPPARDSGPRCDGDEECDDGVECTRDRCIDNTCRNIVDPANCDDGIFCNGMEACDPIMGCMPGDLETCSDGDVCTIDRCDEESKTCRYTGRDFDEDGEVDFFCEGGTDCDDRNPGRGATIAEICDDRIDNDCDEMVDEASCGRPDHDVCEDPLDVSAGGFFELNSTGASPDYELDCAPPGRRDMVLTFTLTESQDVAIRAEGRSTTYVGLRTTCDDSDTELECAGGFPGQVAARALEPGTYFVIVADIGGDLGVEVVFSEPTPPPPNETCASPTDVSEGGTFEATFIDVDDDVRTSCGSSRAPDLVYSFTTTETQDVRLALVGAGPDSLAIGVSSTCGMDDLRCARGAPAGTRLYSLPAGTYFITVEGSASREADFSLTVEFLDPTDAPAGDTCEGAEPLVPGVEAMGTLADKQDDIETSCGFFFRDAVHSFTLTEPADVTLTADTGSFTYMSLRTTCDDEASEIRCTSGNPSRTRVRNLAAGTYFVVVESSRGSGYTLNLETTTPPTVPTMVTGNDVCGAATVVPAGGGLFTGTTTTALNDYETRLCGSGAASSDVAFRVDLTSRSEVFATTEGSTYDTVLHLHQDTCSSMGELACNDDGGSGSSSLIDRELDPGTYFFVVDGFGAASAGSYEFEVLITPL